MAETPTAVRAMSRAEYAAAKYLAARDVKPPPREPRKATTVSAMTEAEYAAAKKTATAKQLKK